jgi:hypothetical protein
MIRNVLLFLAGVVVAWGVVRVWPRAQTWLQSSWVSPGVLPAPLGSNIRVVGGSIHVKIGKYSWTADSPSQLTVNNVDAWSYELENVSEKPGGSPTNVLYVHRSDKWTIDVLVKDPQDPNRGVEILGVSGAAPADGTITFNPINGSDTFSQSNDPGTGPKDRKYHNSMASPHCPDSPDRCEKVDIIRVYVGGTGTPDTWYCVDPDRKCHVDIGS